MMGFEFGEGRPQGIGFVGADATDEVDEGRSATGGFVGLVEGIDHEAGDEFVATVDREVAVGTVVTLLDDEILLREALENRHDGRVGQVASGRQGFVDLSHRLRFGGGPQVVHYCALELA